MVTGKKLRFIVQGLLSLLVVISLAACGKSQGDDSVKRIQDKGTITMGTSADAPPFEYISVQNGKKKIVGFDVLLANKIADELGVKLKIENVSFPALVTELQDKKVDMVLASMVATPARKKVVSFSDTYHEGSNVLLVRKADANKYQKISDLNGKSIGAQQGSAKEQVAKTQLSKAHLVTESGLGTLTTELKVGKIDGVILGAEDSKAYTLKYPDTYATTKIKLKTTSDISAVSVGMNKDDVELKKKVNQVIKRLKKSGELDQMLEQAQKQQLANK
ncbi:amino acid ABC transporter substrate-binding protein [Ligilactobacillus pabuli]|uniref:Amino acid ABC transporter substrate-binding protein n=1 Tax=Ligilactobacillus pabuli TaxID=2886039 RepID=A0ABQ5JJ16_9LACO|nr:transporter substrate-binding domain-containing protein [Ligilactobacillus pabuli]GKS82040.1 amino acid ABC transporter substrate-binding protein [Ligilactobacillus pabuli]